MHVAKNLYFLQPQSEQAISVTRILKKYNNITINAVILNNEKNFSFFDKVYDNVVIVDSYEELFLDKNSILIPFGAKSTESLLSFDDIRLYSVTMTQSALHVYNKPRFLELCKTLNLPIPKTYTNESHIPNHDFPIFYKQKYEKGGGIRGVANSPKELPDKYKEDLIYQEFINSEGTYGVGFIADQGTILINFCHFEEVSYPQSGGSAVIIRKIKNERLVELTESFIKNTNYSGWGLAEFKWCNKRDDFVFMEVNAKLWASCELALLNEPLFIKYLFGLESAKQDEKGVIFINRALRMGIADGLKTIVKGKDLRKVIYPRLWLSISYSVLPNRVLSSIKKLIK